MKITFIGIGIMGSRMACNLSQSNIDLTIYNRSQINADYIKNINAKIAYSLKEAVSDADIVFSMLSKPEAISEVFFGKGKALSSMKRKSIWVDCSTVNPSFSLKAYEEAISNGIKFLDIPVAGSKPQAQNKELVFFAGGSKTVLEVVKPYLDLMGTKIFHIGDIGKGASFKMIVNIMLAQSMVIFSEGVLLGEKMGISKEFLLDLLPNLVVSAPFTKFKVNAIKNDDYEVQFPLELMHKDLHLATLTAYEQNQPLYLANLTKEIYAKANMQGMGRVDFSAIYRYLSKSNN